MGILKVCLKFPLSPYTMLRTDNIAWRKFCPIQCCEPITLLDASFTHCFSTLLRGGRGEKHKIVQITVFPIIFVTDRSDKNCHTFFVLLK